MRRFLAKALATLLVAFSASALAMGLGDIRLNSYLNQRLDAEIELVSAAADEIETLQIGLADPAAFERVGLDRSAALSTLRFNVVRRPNGTAYVHVTSTEPVREPFLSFLVEADWSRGRLLREYTLLIDPPTFADEQDEAPAEARSPVVAETEPAAETLPEPEVPADKPATVDTATPETGSDVDAAVVEAAPEEDVVEEPVREQAEETVSVPPLEAERESSRAPAAPRTGGSYGAIQRNETLWGIASRLKPDDSVTMNQMMVAIYRANPEAFAGNMNRLKQGYILRIPEYVEITTITRAEAFSEARRMNDEWNAARNRYAESDDFRTEPEEEVVEPEADDSLSLVAPDEDIEPEVGTGVGSGGEADDIGTPDEGAVAVDESDVDEGAVDLVEEDDAAADRLIDVEDESMLAVQEGAAGSETDMTEADTGEDIADEAVTEEGAITGETGTDEPVLPEDEPLAESGDTEAVDGEVTDTDETADVTETVEEPAQEEVAETQPDPRTAAPARPPEPGLVEQATRFALSPIGLGIIAGVLVLILVVVMLMQKRRKAAKSQAAAEMADWMADEMGDEDEETTLAASDEDADQEGSGIDSAFGRDEEMEGSGTEAMGGDTDSTQMLRPEDMPEPEPGEGSESSSEPSHADTMIGGETVTMDENDPMSEADFNMAYGLYDQAAEIVANAIDREPSRIDLKAKLCEVHYAANNTDEFVAAAAKLREAAGEDSNEWRDVAIMGQQLAPKDPLFTGGGGGGAAVDLDFGESEAEETPDKPAAGAADDLDFDLDIGGTEETPEEPEKAAAAEEDSLSLDSDLGLDLDMDTGGAAESTDETPPAGGDEPGDFDLGDFDLGESADTSGDAAPETGETAAESSSDDTQTEFDKALSELSAYVDTNLPESDAGDAVGPGDDAGGDLNLDDFSFDSDSGDTAAESDSGTDSDISDSEFDPDSYGSDDGEDELGEIGTKLDLARAYIDMGDPDGAKGILQEVLEDGDETQKAEAQSLLDKL